MPLAALEGPFETLQVTEPDASVLLVTLNRPERANAFTTRMAEELLAAFGARGAEPDAYRCVVLTGAGERAFCAGADLKERDGMTDADFSRQHYLFERCFRSLLACPPPLIAALNGAALARRRELG